MNARLTVFSLGLILLLAASAKAQFEQLDPWNKNSGVNKAGIRLNDVPPFKRHPPEMSHLSGGGGGTSFRSGAVLVNNDYGNASFQIRLYHPQAPGRVFSTWNLTGNRQMLNFNTGPVVVGSDWGIQIIFGNGVTSPIRYVGSISGHDGRTFLVDASRIFGG